MASIKTIKVEPQYELTLSQAEAQLLRDILHKVGGFPDGPRKYAESIKTALREGGLSPLRDDTIDGTLYLR